jgi:excisionase family DNA binding protein
MSASMRVFPPKKVAELLDVSRATIKKLIKNGDLPSIQISDRRIGILEQDLQEYISAGRAQRTASQLKFRSD